jgi:predicted metalloprotease with PDZ domain
LNNQSQSDNENLKKELTTRPIFTESGMQLMNFDYIDFPDKYIFWEKVKNIQKENIEHSKEN